ncbi:hypothetical protein MNV49_005903 [Pseudohyphozyma bogoriensis]|nr:hypothetical protein MNV49_005903 [Pseudohyphozyma bogoriensis]
MTTDTPPPPPLPPLGTNKRAPLKPLSTQQELRLVNYLDSQFLTLSRAHSTRHSPLSQVPTVEAYLAQLAQLNSFILSIPPVGASAPLRVAFYLQLISLLPPSLSSYPLTAATLPHLFTSLSTFDSTTLIVLKGEEWDSTTSSSRGPASPASESGVRATDRVRLASMIEDIKKTLRLALGIPSLSGERVRVDGEVVEPRMRVGAGSASVTSGGSSFRIPELEESTPSLTTDYSEYDDESMAELEDPTDGSGEEVEDEDEEDEFEQVDIEEAQGGFTINFSGPPPMSPPVSEAVISDVASEPARGFDPDSEYPEDESEREEEAVDEQDEAMVREQVERVFEGSLKWLKALEEAA